MWKPEHDASFKAAINQAYFADSYVSLELGIRYNRRSKIEWLCFCINKQLTNGGADLKVIPVIDILNSLVVHAVKGERSQYKPLQSSIIDSAQPLEVAKALQALGFKELYVADLDAIISCTSDFGILNQIAQTGLTLLVDAGITSVDRAQKLFGSGVSKLIVGTETLQTTAFVEEALKGFGGDRVVISLDLKNGKLLAKEGFDGSGDPLSLVQKFEDMGVEEVIVLDLARVGSGLGVDTAFIGELIEETTVDVYVGGGVRGLDDLVELRSLGVAGALVATALHNGKITIEGLKKEGFL